jgi:methionine synthase reductase
MSSPIKAEQAGGQCYDDKCSILHHHLSARKKTSEMLSKRHRFLVLYGSETGNSKSIAEKVQEQAIARNIPAKLHTLDEYESLGIGATTLNVEPEYSFCAIVVSTTGNGDAPKGAERFFRYVKKRTLPADSVKNLSYSVLALGDTNYDKFCFVGKTIDTRLQAVGGKQLAPVVLADDVVGLDTVVEPWIAKLWEIYGALHEQDVANASAATNGLLTSPSFTLKKQLSAETASTNSTENKLTNNASSIINVGRSNVNVGWTFAKTFKGFEIFPDSCGTAELAVNKTKRLGKVRDPFPASKYVPSKTSFRPCNIKCGDYLTKDFPGEHRVVMKMTAEIPEDVEWNIGDSIAIQTPNPHDLVIACCERLKLNSKEVISHSPDGEESWTIYQLFSQGVNLATPPDRGFLRTLSCHCTNPLDRARMDLLSTSGGRDEYEKLVEVQRLNVVEVLKLFPSCVPPLDSFLGALGPEPPPPRYYSIASSPLTNSNQADICFSVVQTVIDENRTVKGVCTNELERLMTQLPQTIMMFVKSNPTFKLPADETRPIIMVGPGTGVAPFMGFIQHRPANRKSIISHMKASAPVCGSWRGGLDFEDELEAAEDALCLPPYKARTPDVQIGTSTLYFGCRRPEQDFLFRKELEELAECGSLTKLRVAFSRVEPKQYVQDLIIKDGQELADQIINQSAYFYVCGDGTKMAKDVQQAVLQILCDCGRMDTEEAKNYIAEMQKRGRYVQDIW